MDQQDEDIAEIIDIPWNDDNNFDAIDDDEISDPDPDDDDDSSSSSFDQGVCWWEALEHQTFLRHLDALRRNSPTHTSLELLNGHYFVPDNNEARALVLVDGDDGDDDGGDEMENDGPDNVTTIADLLHHRRHRQHRHVHHEENEEQEQSNPRVIGLCPTTVKCLECTIRDGSALLTKLTLKEDLVTRFHTRLIANIFEKLIAKSKSLKVLKFYGLQLDLHEWLHNKEDDSERRLFLTALFQALTDNQSIESLEIKRVVVEEHFFHKLLTKDKSTLRRLEVAGCLLVGEAPADALTQAFYRNQGLVSLHWQRNSPFLLEALLKGIENHKQLKDLSLHADDTTDAESLGVALSKCPVLERFFWFSPRTYNCNGQYHFDISRFFFCPASEPLDSQSCSSRASHGKR